MSQLDEIVERMKVAALDPVAFADALGDLYADEVYVRHDPPMPFDGPTTGEHVAKLHREETRVWMERVPDYHHEDVSVWSDGEDMRMTLALVGTLPDGNGFRVDTRFRQKIRDGRIYDAELGADKEASKAMMALVVEEKIPVDLIWDPFAAEA